ncbi:hypothetical protein GCM10009555_070930 [Acrocarpospora macrocephala]|uniref:Uncharacterized protein n=1 Tax=Acrocarpospora macrocephala TaxID=150177 RepID=A0A5M3WK56_9ACTN|nr:hypothetical protein [Acrocarpospora macrocephala]GES08760.1 hypothetical protein Amac_023560 [Acrocarpospora macrocephala]
MDSPFEWREDDDGAARLVAFREAVERHYANPLPAGLRRAAYRDLTDTEASKVPPSPPWRPRRPEPSSCSCMPAPRSLATDSRGRATAVTKAAQERECVFPQEDADSPC